MDLNIRAKQKQSNKPFNTGNVILISIAHFLHDIYTSFLAPILPIIIKQLQLSYAAAGTLTVVLRLPSLLNPFVGIIADKISIRYFVIVAPALTAFFMTLTGNATSYIFLVILLFFAGISSALFHVPAPVMIKKESGDFVGRGMSFFMIGGELARTLGPLTVIGAVSVWGFSGIWRLIFPGIAASVFLFFRIRSIPISREVKNIQPTTTPLENARKFSGFFLTIFMFLLCQSSMKSALVAYLPTYLNTEGQSLWSGGISLSIFQTSGVFGTLLAGNISDLIGRKKTLLFSSVAAPIFMLLFLTVPSLFSMFFLVLTGITLFASGPVLLAFVQDKAANSPSFFNGIHMTVTFITGAITIFLVGFISDITSMEHAFFFSAGIAAFSVLFVWRLPSK